MDFLPWGQEAAGNPEGSDNNPGEPQTQQECGERTSAQSSAPSVQLKTTNFPSLSVLLSAWARASPEGASRSFPDCSDATQISSHSSTLQTTTTDAALILSPPLPMDVSFTLLRSF